MRKGAQTMKKLEQIERQEQKTRNKIAALQDILKDIGKQRTEQEDLQIIQKFRALKLSREELYVFLGGGELPPVLAAAVGNATAAEPEVIHSRPDRKRNKGRRGVDANTAEGGAIEGEAADHEDGHNPDHSNPGDNADHSNPYGYNADSENTNLESEGN